VKIALVALSILVALVLGAALIVPGLIDWTPYRARIAAEIGAVTGRDVAIGGPLSFSMLPAPHLSAGDVRIASVPGAEDPTLMSARSVDLEMALLPLLRGDLAIREVVLVEPRLVLETLPDGRRNWPRIAIGTGDLSVARLSVERGQISWIDRKAGRRYDVAGIGGTLTGLGTGSTTTLVGSANMDGIPFTVDLAAQAASALGAVPFTVKLGADGVAGEASFGGLWLAEGAVQGDLAVTGADLAAALRRFGIDAPPGAAARFAARAALRAGARDIALTGLSVELGDLRAAGTAALALGNAPRLDLGLAANRIAAAPWLGLDGASDGTAVSMAVLRRLDGIVLPPGLTGRFSLSAEAVETGSAFLRDVRLDAGFSGGTISIADLSAALPGAGRLRLAGSVTPAAAGTAATLTAALDADDLRGLLDWAGIDVDRVPGAKLRRFSLAFSWSGTLADFRITGLDATIDGARVTGALAFAAGDRPGIGLRLAIDRLDIDAYRPDGAPPLIGSAIDDPSWRAYLAGLADGIDATLDLTLGDVTLDRLRFADIRLDAGLSSGTLGLRTAALRGPGGLRLSASGRIDDAAAFDGMDLALSVAAEDPAPALRLARQPGLAALFDGQAAAVDGRLHGDLAALSLDADIRALGGSLALGGMIGSGSPLPTADLRMRLTQEDLGALLARLSPSLGLPRPLGGADLYAHLVSTGEAAALEDVQGRIGPVELAGRGDVILAAGGRPRVAAALRTTALALDTLLPERWHDREAALAGQWSARPIDLAGLGAFDGSLVLTAASLSWGPWRLDGTDVSLALADGTLSLKRLTGGIAGGRLGVTGTLAPLDGQAALGLAVDLVGADAGLVLHEGLGATQIGGTLDLGFAGSSRGGSLAGLVAGLEGRGLIALRDATIDGFDLAAVDRLLADPGAPVAFLDSLRRALDGGRSRFAAVNATYTVGAGVLRADDLRLAGDVARGTGSLAFDLPRWSIDLVTRFAFHARQAAGELGIAAQGAPGAPVRRLDTQALQDYVAARAAAAIAPARP
jgi:uncharacterized protein involved in outer membrane biogenesis